MNVIDRLVSAIDPVAGIKRQQARVTMGKLREIQNSGYDHSGASSTKKSMAGWVHSSLSPKEDIDYNLDTLRQRSRDLYMSSPIATSAVKNNRTNVVGSGLQLKSTIDYASLGITREQAIDYETQIEREFGLWATSKLSDTLGLNDFYELQQLGMMSWLINGDVFVVMKHRKRTPYMPYGLNLHMVEADRVSTPNASTKGRSVVGKAATGNSIVSGVETDVSGMVVAYHFCSAYPNSSDSLRKTWQRVEARGAKTGNPNVLHIMESERCEQYRGIPYLAPVIEALKQITRYTEAEIMAAVVTAFFTAFIKTTGDRTEIPMGESIAEADRVAVDDEAPNYQLGAGTINVLGEGEDVTFANPTRPASGFDMFVTAISTQIGAALEVPAEMLLKRFSSSYSASRAAFLEAWKAFKMRRVWFAKDFCQPVYELFLADAVALGRLRLPGFFVDPIIKRAWCGAQWNGPSQGQIDPTKEVEASIMKVAHGFSTHAKETMELTGGDFTQNAMQCKQELELLGQSEDALQGELAMLKEKREKESMKKDE